MFLREPSHILLVILVLVVLFGAKRLPDSAKSLARSLKIFKSEMKDGDNKKNKDVSNKSKKKIEEEGLRMRSVAFANNRSERKKSGARKTFPKRPTNESNWPSNSACTLLRKKCTGTVLSGSVSVRMIWDSEPRSPERRVSPAMPKGESNTKG